MIDKDKRDTDELEASDEGRNLIKYPHGWWIVPMAALGALTVIGAAIRRFL